MITMIAHNRYGHMHTDTDTLNLTAGLWWCSSEAVSGVCWMNCNTIKHLFFFFFLNSSIKGMVLVFEVLLCKGFVTRLRTEPFNYFSFSQKGYEVLGWKNLNIVPTCVQSRTSLWSSTGNCVVSPHLTITVDKEKWHLIQHYLKNRNYST